MATSAAGAITLKPAPPPTGTDWDDAPEGLIDRLLAQARTVTTSRGTVLAGPGDSNDDVYLLLDGHVRITLFPANGREVLIRDVGPGHLFGELSALDGSPRSATMVTLAPSRLAAVRAADFRAALATDAGAGAWLARHLARQLRVMTNRVFELSALSASARLHCHLLRLAGQAGIAGDCAHIDPAPTHEALAAAIGSQRETVTRELGALSHAGLLRRQGPALIVPRVSALAASLHRDGHAEPERPAIAT
jgi:CRP-like cAMP-binding protein